MKGCCFYFVTDLYISTLINKRLFLSTLLCSTLLFGCATEELASAEQEYLLLAPENWQSKAIENSQPLTYQQRWGVMIPEAVDILLQTALSDNQQVLISRQRVKQIAAGLAISDANLLPELKLLATKSHRDSLTNNQLSHSQSSSLSVNATWELDLWQRLGDVNSASAFTLTAAEADLQALQLSTQGQVLASWLAIVEENKLLHLINKNITVQSRRLLLSERRLDLGLVNSIDVRNGKTSLARLQASAAQARLNISKAKRKLQGLLGTYPDSKLTNFNQLPTLTPLPLLSKPQSILLNRPDLQASFSQLQAQGYHWQAAKKALLPKISFNASWGAREEHFSDLFDLDYWLGAVTGSLVQPIFYRGKLQAEVDKRQASQQIALLNFKQDLLQAWQEVENALQSESVLANREQILTLALQQAKAAEDLTERQYEMGLATSFELLATQRTSINTETDLIKVSVGRIKNRINLLLAVGVVNEQEINRASTLNNTLNSTLNTQQTSVISPKEKTS